MLKKSFFIISIIALQACTDKESQQGNTQVVNEPFKTINDSSSVNDQPDHTENKTFESGHFYTHDDLKLMPFTWDISASDKRFNVQWTNGVQWFSLDRSKDVGCMFGVSTRPYIHLSGGDRHEGGLSLLGILQNDSTIHVLGSYVNDVYQGDLLRAYNFNGVDCLVVLNSDSTFKSVIVDSNLDLGNDEDISVQKNLAGRWGDSNFGNEIEFFNIGRRVIWNGEEKQFHFESGEYDELLNVFSIEGDSYFFKRTEEKLFLYKIDKEADDWEYSGYQPEHFDTEYLIQESSKELSFEVFKRNVSAIFKK